MVSRFIRMLMRKGPGDDCVEVRNLSSDFIDEELDDAAVQRVRTHISWCGPCNAFINTLRSTIDLLRASPKHEAPEDLRQRIRDNIQSERKR